MTIIVVASSKGGPGKTLLAQLLTGRLAADGYTVGAIDADPTKGLHRWLTTIYEGPPIEARLETDEVRLAHLIPDLAPQFDVLVVDTAGFGNRAANLAMIQADLVLVPMLPGEGDTVEAARTVELVRALERGAKRAIPVRVVLNRMRSTTVARHAVGQVIDLPQLQTTLAERTAYAEVGFSGRVPVTGRAGEETTALLDELRRGDWLPSSVMTHDAGRTTKKGSG